jgi:hypothetical protein
LDLASQARKYPVVRVLGKLTVRHFLSVIGGLKKSDPVFRAQIYPNVVWFNGGFVAYYYSQ